MGLGLFSSTFKRCLFYKVINSLIVTLINWKLF